MSCRFWRAEFSLRHFSSSGRPKTNYKGQVKSGQNWSKTRYNLVFIVSLTWMQQQYQHFKPNLTRLYLVFDQYDLILTTTCNWCYKCVSGENVIPYIKCCMCICLSVCDLLVTKMLVTLLHVSHTPQCQSHNLMLVTHLHVSHTSPCQSNYSMLVTLLHVSHTPPCQSHQNVGRGAPRSSSTTKLMQIKSFSMFLFLYF